MFGKKTISFLGGSDDGFGKDMILPVEKDVRCKVRGLIAALKTTTLDALFDEDLLMRRREA